MKEARLRKRLCRDPVELRVSGCRIRLSKGPWCVMFVRVTSRPFPRKPSSPGLRHSRPGPVASRGSALEGGGCHRNSRDEVGR